MILLKNYYGNKIIWLNFEFNYTKSKSFLICLILMYIFGILRKANPIIRFKIIERN